jgi:hypothetical protein
VLTCAHVVECVLGLPVVQEPPDGRVLLEFPDAAPGALVPAHVPADGWFRAPPVADLAVLRPAGTLPQGAVPAPVDAGPVPEGADVLVYGHPAQAPDGIWATARTVGAGGPYPGWWQLDGAGRAGPRIEPGFSGSGVRDSARDRVIGVLAAALEQGYGPAADPSASVAWMIPLALLAGTPYALPADPATAPAPRPPTTAPAPEHPAVPHAVTRPEAAVPAAPAAAAPGTDPLWAVVDALLAVDLVGADGGAELIRLLPEPIRFSVPRAARPRTQVLHLVRRCGDFADGPAALVRVVRQAEGDTLPVQHFLACAGQLWPDRLA